MFRTTHIRTKLAAALAVPLVGLGAIAAFEVVTASNQVEDLQDQSELATSSIGPGSLLVHLQDERNRAAIDLIGLGDAAGLPVESNEEARGLTDEAVPELQSLLQSRGGDVEAAFAPAWETMADLQDLRADIDAYDGPTDLSNDELANEVFSRYTTIIEAFFDGTTTLARSVDDAALRNGVEIIDAAARQSEMRARIVRSVVLSAVTGTVDAPEVGQEVAALYDRAKGFDADIVANAAGPYAGIGDATFEEPAVQSFNSQVEAFLAGSLPDITALLTSVQSQPDIGYTGLRSRAAEALSSEADRVEADAVERQQLVAGIALAALLLALLVTSVASRSITRPLRSLRTQAEEMAGTRLPTAVRQILETPPGEDVVIPEVEPITVDTRDEVAEVAAALSAVQASAVDLAVEQAVLRRNISDSYINLGRRNQNLLSRQLDFITELERNEADPDTLEGLFRLDHLATRMRRNAESLLVLAGIEPPRQWAAPVQLSDVVRAALGEVEDYHRVVVRHLEPASMTGSVASDVAHVLAELLENALSFSPPDEHVEVKGRLTTSGYTIAVTDNGLGMSPDDVARANRRLAGAESFTVAPSRYLGHYVAGHLASRLGVVVELQDSPAGGITARIDVPMSLLDDDELEPGFARREATSRPAPAPAAPAPAPTPGSHDDAVRSLGAGLAAAGGLGNAPATPDASPAATPAPDPSPVTASGLPRRGAPRQESIDLDLDSDEPTMPTAPAAPSGPAHFAGSRNGRSAARPEPVPVAASEQDDDELLAAPPAASAPRSEWRADDPEPWEQETSPAADVTSASPSLPQRDRFSPSWDTIPGADPQPARDAEPIGAQAAPGPEPDLEPAMGEAAPAPTATRGFGGLAMAQPVGASMFTVVAKNAREARENGTPADAGTTATGLARRVPGAQRPDAAFGTRAASAAPSAAVEEEPAPSTSPEDVYSFLSNFQSGVERGRAAATTDTSTTEEDR